MPGLVGPIAEKWILHPGARGVVTLMESTGFRDVRYIPVLGGLMAIHLARR